MQLQEGAWGNFLLSESAILHFVRDSQPARAYLCNGVPQDILCPRACLILHGAELGYSRAEVQDFTLFPGLRVSWFWLGQS